MGVKMSILRKSIGSITTGVAALIVIGLLVVVKSREIAFDEDHSLAQGVPQFGMDKKFLSEDAVDAAMLNSLTAIFRKSGH